MLAAFILPGCTSTYDGITPKACVIVKVPSKPVPLCTDVPLLDNATFAQFPGVPDTIHLKPYSEPDAEFVLNITSPAFHVAAMLVGGAELQKKEFLTALKTVAL